MRSRKAVFLFCAAVVAVFSAVLVTVVSRRILAVPADTEIVRIPISDRAPSAASVLDVPEPSSAADDQPLPPPAVEPDTVQPSPAAAPSLIVSPLPEPAGRISKKPFGLYVRPGESPVSPERFQGHHTGVDFETFPEEQGRDVPVAAVCDGPLLVKRTASGYGGVAAQSCRIADREATVVYGHLKLSSIVSEVGDRLAAGDRLGILGRGFSPETDGERKHLHLSIHLGTEIDIKGYVQDRAALDRWLDPAELGGWK